jgi:aminoglycoside phosphotransferase family enzyme/predicted kinase
MLEPAFYPHRPDRIELVETHISWVFLAGDLAYKMRKPVVFPFLDYGSAERRRDLCEEELRLGKRFAPSIYRRVRSIVEREPGCFELADAGAPNAIEHVVEMCRVDSTRTLETLLATDDVTDEDVRRIARRIADLHAAAAVAPGRAWTADRVAAAVNDNFATLLAHAEVVGPHDLAAAHRAAVAFLHRHRRLLDWRAAEGHAADCHGDLRAAHVVVGFTIECFDPIEFDPTLRQIDVAADLAFLVMELHAARRPDLARVLAHEYRAAGGDYGSDALLDFYASYRAWVRVKVACLRAAQVAGVERERALEEARRLVPVARELDWRARRPLVLVVFGRAASGKSSLAAELAARSGLPVLSSDVIRKELAGVSAEERAPDPAYSEEASLLVYSALGARAAAVRSRSVIVDATFRRRRHRAAFARAYGDTGPRPLFVQCIAPDAVLVERARQRDREATRISDADTQVVARQAAELEPLDEVPPNAICTIRTDREVARIADDVEAWLDERALGECVVHRSEIGAATDSVADRGTRG